MADRVRDAETQNTRVEALLAAPDARLVAGEMAGGRVSLIVSPSRNAAVAILQGLRSPGDGQAYQLWMIVGSAPKSVGLLPAATGTGRAYIEGLGDASTFAVSKERAKGADAPTEPIIGAMPLQ